VGDTGGGTNVQGQRESNKTEERSNEKPEKITQNP